MISRSDSISPTNSSPSPSPKKRLSKTGSGDQELSYTDRRAVYLENLKKIKTFLSTMPEYRKQKDCVDISKLLENVKFLEQFKGRKELIELCRYMEIEIFPPKTPVFNQGDHGDKFYIILEGFVSVFINIKDELSQVVQKKEVAKLDIGDSFGELALLNDSIRSATILTQDITSLIVLSRETFRKYVKDLSSSSLQKIIEVYQTFPVLQGIKKAVLEKLASKTLVKGFHSKTIFGKQGKACENVYFIKSGRVQVVRNVKLRIKMETNELVDDVHGPTQAEIAAGLFVEIPLEIDEIGAGDSIGDYEVLNGCKMLNSYVCSMASQCFVLSPIDYGLTVDNAAREEVKRKLKAYPEDEELRESYFREQKWKKYKESINANYLLDHYFAKSIINKAGKAIDRGPQLKRPKIDKSLFHQSIEDEAELAIRMRNILDEDLRGIVDDTVIPTASKSMTTKPVHTLSLPRIVEPLTNAQKVLQNISQFEGKSKSLPRLKKPKPQNPIVNSHFGKAIEVNPNERALDLSLVDYYVRSKIMSFKQC